MGVALSVHPPNATFRGLFLVFAAGAALSSHRQIAEAKSSFVRTECREWSATAAPPLRSPQLASPDLAWPLCWSGAASRCVRS